MAEYEFTNEENTTFDSLASALRRFALTFATWAGLLVLMGLAGFTGGRSAYGNIAMIVVGGATIVLALMFLKPVGNFKRITTTQGQDVSELLGALDELNKSFSLLRIFVALFFVAITINATRILLG